MFATYQIPESVRLLFKSAVGNVTRVTAIESFESLEGELASRAAEEEIVVVGREPISLTADPAKVARLRAVSPRAVIIVMDALKSEDTEHVAALVRAGADVVFPTNGKRSIRDLAKNAVEEAKHRSTVAAIRRLLDGRLSPEFDPFVEACMTMKESPKLSVIYASIGLSKGRLWRLAVRHRLPRPEWIRAVVVLGYCVRWMEGQPGRTLRKVASRIGISETALANRFRRTLGMTSKEAMAVGSAFIVERIFDASKVAGTAGAPGARATRKGRTDGASRGATRRGKRNAHRKPARPGPPPKGGKSGKRRPKR